MASPFRPTQPERASNGDGTIAAVSVAVRRGDKLLLVRRGRAPALGLYAFPGGRVEAGETRADAVRRELREETGLLAGEVSFLDKLRIERETETGPVFELSVYLCSDAKGEPTAADDAADAGFFGLDEMATLPMTESTLRIAQTLLGGHASRHLP